MHKFTLAFLFHLYATNWEFSSSRHREAKEQVWRALFSRFLSTFARVQDWPRPPSVSLFLRVYATTRNPRARNTSSLPLNLFCACLERWFRPSGRKSSTTSNIFVSFFSLFRFLVLFYSSSSSCFSEGTRGGTMTTRKRFSRRPLSNRWWRRERLGFCAFALCARGRRE